MQVPIARTDWVEETRTDQVPVTTYRTVPEEIIVRDAGQRAAGQLAGHRRCDGRRQPADRASSCTEAIRRGTAESTWPSQHRSAAQLAAR